MRALVRPLLVVLSALAAAGAVAPRPAYADEALARQHFKRGIDLYDRKRYAEALAAFQDAYREKPSAGIKQNVALCLKGLGKPAEAATAFDEALDEGKGTLKPETTKAIDRELAELAKIVATVTFIVVNEEKRPVEGAVISVEPAGEQRRALAPAALRRPLRLMPGIYTFSARIPGYPDPPDKKLALVTGQPIEATFVASATPLPIGPGVPGQQGKLTIRASREDATIRINGVEVGRGSFSHVVATGAYKVEVSSPGWRTTTLDVSVAGGDERDVPVILQAIGDAPPEYVAPPLKPPKVTRWYAVPAVELATASYRLGVALDEPTPYGTRRGDFTGAALGARLGYHVGRSLSVEVLTDIGQVTAKYKLQATDPADTETKILHGQITPMLRLTVPRAAKIRFTTGTGAGLHGLSLKSTLPRKPTITKEGGGFDVSWLIDAGLQIELDPIFLEGVFFADVHGLTSVKDDAPGGGARLLYASPAVRGGLRVGVGVAF